MVLSVCVTVPEKQEDSFVMLGLAAGSVRGRQGEP